MQLYLFFYFIFTLLISTVHASTPLSTFAKRALTQHNKYRAQYSASPLKWSPALAKTAQKWADRCVFEHGGGVAGGYGENLAAGYATIQAAVDDWVNGDNEASSYDPNNPTASHFTQVVWKGTVKVGCAFKSCNLAVFGGAKANLYVCEYDPPGNVFPAENFKKNVAVKSS